MAKVDDFYSVKEADLPVAERRYHDHNCGPSSLIKKEDIRYGTNGYKRCEQCEKLVAEKFVLWKRLAAGTPEEKLQARKLLAENKQDFDAKIANQKV